jgi:hypothetical protein
MVKRADRGKLVEGADASAHRHLEAARLLAKSGLNSYAAFHMITAIEEIAKGRLEEGGMMDLFRGTKWEGKGVSQQLDQARHRHSVKIPFGIMLLTFDGTMLATGDVAATGGPAEAGEGATARRPVLETVTWLIELLQKHPNLREEAIYSGPGPDGQLPVPVDWEQLVFRLLPLLERVVDFQSSAHLATLSAEQIQATRGQVIALASEALAELDRTETWGASRSS